MVTVMNRCSVMSSEGKIGSEGRLMKGMAWLRSATSPTTRVTRPVIPDSGVIWEEIWWKDFD